jgi:hypothetical protein
MPLPASGRGLQEGFVYTFKTFQTPSKLKYNHIQKLKGEFSFAHPRYWSIFIAQGLQ